MSSENGSRFVLGLKDASVRQRHSHLASDYQPYVDQRLIVKEIIFKSTMEYYSSVISDAGSGND